MARAKQTEWATHAQKAKLPDGFQERIFKGKNWGKGCKVCAFLLTDWWCGRRVMFKESLQAILHLGENVSFSTITQRY